MKVTSNNLEISIVTCNLLHRQILAHPKHDVQWIIDTWAPDIIGCQEAEGYGTVLKGFKGYGYALGAGAKGNGREVPILYNTTSLRLASVSTTLMTKGVAGHDPSRFVTTAHFVTRTDGQSIWYFNTHVNHHIEATGSDPSVAVGPRGTPRPGPQTTAAITHFKKMAEMVKARAMAGAGVAFWGGDFNVDIIADMNHPGGSPFFYEIFRNHGLLSIQEELNKDSPGRDIDVIGSCTQDKNITGVRMLRHNANLYSDHAFIRADYTIPRGSSSGGADTPGTGSSSGSFPTMPGDGDNFDFTDVVPVPFPDTPLEPVLRQPTSTWDHSVCCKKNG